MAFHYAGGNPRYRNSNIHLFVTNVVDEQVGLLDDFGNNSELPEPYFFVADALFYSSKL